MMIKLNETGKDYSRNIDRLTVIDQVWLWDWLVGYEHATYNIHTHNSLTQTNCKNTKK